MTLLLKQREYQEKYSNDFYFYLITFYINPFFFFFLKKFGRCLFWIRLFSASRCLQDRSIWRCCSHHLPLEWYAHNAYYILHDQNIYVVWKEGICFFFSVYNPCKIPERVLFNIIIILTLPSWQIWLFEYISVFCQEKKNSYLGIHSLQEQINYYTLSIALLFF